MARGIAFILVLGLLVPLLAADARTTHANVDDTWDYPAAKRILRYCSDKELDRLEVERFLTWGEEIRSAAWGWNQESTGWTLDNGGTFSDVEIALANCDIVIVALPSGAWASGLFGEAHLRDYMTTFLPVIDGKRLCLIFVNLTPEKNAGRSWGVSGPQHTERWHPGFVLMHELGHCLRLDHSTAGRVMSNGGVGPGEDNPLAGINDDDRQEAVDAVTKPVRRQPHVITPEDGAIIQGREAIINIPPGAVETPEEVTGESGTFLSSPLDSDEIPRVYASVILTPEIVLQKPAVITMSYERFFSADPLPAEGFLDLSPIVPSNAALPGVEEDGLRIVRFDYTTKEWQPAGSAVIDFAAKTITATVSELGTYGYAPSPPVGGTVELVVESSEPSTRSAAGPGSSAPPYAAIAGGAAAAAAVALAAGGWHARRRFRQPRI